MRPSTFRRNLKLGLAGTTFWLASVVLGHWLGLLPKQGIGVLGILLNAVGFLSAMLVIFGVMVPLGASQLRDTTPPTHLAKPRYAGVRLLIRLFAIRADKTKEHRL